MSKEHVLGDPGNFEDEISQRVALGDAIRHAHSKLTMARSKDVALREAEAEGSYRFVQFAVKMYADKPRRHALITLLPPRGESAADSAIVRMVLDTPTDNWEDASDHSKAMYAANVSAQQISMAALAKRFSPEPFIVPAQTMFGEAFKVDGTSMRFLLGPESLDAYSSELDILEIESANTLGGQEYAIARTYETAALQAELKAEWFEPEGLRDYIRNGEPIQFGGFSSSSSVAS